MSLPSLLKAEIRAQGPLTIGRFMGLALGHPKFGYYNTRDPFGEAGDFTTAPEISQMFGELLGAWAAQIWFDLGIPQNVTLLECGPGRGTLMADALRATKNVKGFHQCLNVTLMEMSPVLREKQEEVLADYSPHWIKTLDELSGEGPVILLANEFLDALPVRHLEYAGGQWLERAVGVSRDEAFVFVHIPAPDELLALIPPGLPAPQDGDMLELSPDRAAFMGEVFSILKRRGGAVLFLDYGYVAPAYGETLQALYKHEFSPVLERIGEADLTAHVDFAALQRAAESAGVTAHGIVTQGAFLKALGIEARAAMLSKSAGAAQAENIRKALHRLTHSDEMGTLFKVIGFSHGLKERVAGF
ncbi:MAG: SAM-dependent methyltransferase [Alphaproteobacteria bacterium]|nr:SAM-dependent methyltransferase [Alphaproteobacteria bacterium]